MEFVLGGGADFLPRGGVLPFCGLDVFVFVFEFVVAPLNFWMRSRMTVGLWGFFLFGTFFMGVFWCSGDDNDNDGAANFDIRSAMMDDL
jgi:hypothetical protein